MESNISVLIIFLLLFAILFLGWKYLMLREGIESEVRKRFESWKRDELESAISQRLPVQLAEWKRSEEKHIRASAIKMSEAVIKGKITEHLVPYFPEFRHNPKDVRFIGSPVDLIVFDGLSDANEIRNVAFIEIKTGKLGTLTPREKMVQQCIRNRCVTYETIHLGAAVLEDTKKLA